ncbi:Uncharacterised protein [Rodentibacter pneumotropicus]|uniref:Uncharacterized protein n=1 Tax=Rodentibacter pneumotropicus TaxID=758 RepID=A0A448MMN6_9PAST|nr:Uncharacterised protein [Rodentibacter pneumotropicus]
MALVHRAKASLVKGVTMGGFGMFILLLLYTVGSMAKFLTIVK